MLNVVAADFALKTESVFALQRFGIGCDHLVFKDSLDMKHLQDKLEVTLVDHNVMTSFDGALDCRVTEVIDHHVRTRPVHDKYVVT